jgi:hypothetical protein
MEKLMRGLTDDEEVALGRFSTEMQSAEGL